MKIRRIESKCTGCMLCVRDCVSGVWRAVDGTPTVVAPDLCNRCSHCLAVCPKGAIEHDILKAKQIKRIKKANIKPEYYREIALGRRSIRQYKNKGVPRSVIKDIIDVARYSPTASNDQNVGYIIVTDRKLIQNISNKIYSFSNSLYGLSQKAPLKYLMKASGSSDHRYLKLMEYTRELTDAGRDLILHHAPVLILIHAPAKARFACDNCNIAATNIINYAYTLGVGTAYNGFLQMAIRFSKKVRKQLHIPKKRKVFACLTMGYPAYSYSYTASRKEANIEWI